jgi:hypothetical protein
MAAGAPDGRRRSDHYCYFGAGFNETTKPKQLFARSSYEVKIKNYLVQYLNAARVLVPGLRGGI